MVTALRREELAEDSSQETNADPESLAGRLLESWPDLAGRLMGEGLASVVPMGMPDDHYDQDVLPVVVTAGYAVLGAIASDEEPDYAAVSEVVRPVALQHVEERLPPSRLVTGIHLSAQVLLDAAAEEARPDETDQLVTLGRRLLRVLTAIDLVVVDTYMGMEDSAFEAEREARRELCDALVNGRPAAALAARANTSVSDRYLVASLKLDVDPNEAPPGLLLRRRRRVLQAGLDELTADITPAMFNGHEGIALISEPALEAQIGDPRWDVLAKETTEKLGVGVYVALLDGIGPGEIPRAAQEAAELGRLAHRLNRGPGVYRIDDLMLEYQVTRPSPARDRLAELVEPLFDQPHLLEALYAHLEHGGDRKSAAAELHVHPNSYTYRLRRIHEMTGLDPTRPRESRMLAAALLVAGRWENLPG
ncbi:MAG: helix-turn-helix domain-containing protein [Gordonia sp. (in: high G+C Gram-positive bacteria)]|uniref:PucR family transcriptional regulator n=1 Tax=Gordonia sp. (in: high G+C Gram-positive bacteria) TaxID=84139 RepID=UPI0039E71ABF